MGWSVRQQGFCQKQLQKALPWRIRLQCSLVDFSRGTGGQWVINACMWRIPLQYVTSICRQAC